MLILRFKIEQKIGMKIMKAQREYNRMQKSVRDQSRLRRERSTNLGNK